MRSLLEPLSFRNGSSAPNRVALAAMTNLQSQPDGTLGDDELVWLRHRAEGGFGLLCTCASHVALDGQGWANELGVYDDKLLPGLRTLAATLRAQGGLALMQLFHGGVRAPSSVTGLQPWSASEFTEERPDFEPPRAATGEDILRVVAQFRAAAERAVAAGFDGVELHGAHGYLLSQFLSRTQNTRDDAWGGPFENRARLLRTVLREVRAAVPKAVVGVRISPEDFGQARGLDLDESLELARWIADDGADFLHLSLWDTFRTTSKRVDRHPIPLFREVLPSDVRIVVAGRIWTRDEGEKALALGADMVALGRSAVANPDWPQRIAEPRWAPKRPPLSRAELRARGLSESFVEYMTRWKGFVGDEP